MPLKTWTPLSSVPSSLPAVLSTIVALMRLLFHRPQQPFPWVRTHWPWLPHSASWLWSGASTALPCEPLFCLAFEEPVVVVEVVGCDGAGAGVGWLPVDGWA